MTASKTAPKAWTYDQSTGDLFDPDGRFVGTGYSGKGRTLKDGRNNGKMEDVVATGPPPVGLYTFGPSRTHPRLGPIAMPLTPVDHDARGRSGFFIHGDNSENDASLGCPILGRDYRRRLDSTPAGERFFKVVP